MVRLSVNVNKIATLRNSRGGAVPSPIRAVQACLTAGVHGITVHPRADARHITRADVYEIAAELAPFRGPIELNIEGDPRPDLLELVHEVVPDQCTLVPVRPGEITSEAGWPASTPEADLRATVAGLRAAGIRVSLFVDADPAPVRWAAAIGADRVELYTEPYARAFAQGPAAAMDGLVRFRAAAELAHGLGLGVNAGHDLDLDNLPLFATLPHLDEVSIGHAIVSRAVFVGLETVVREYLDLLEPEGQGRVSPPAPR
jgi:pyridoxine 5-phosphate synthase